MFLSSLFGNKKSILGVDIGTSNIKIAQITHNQQPVLDTYGVVNVNYQLGAKNDDEVITQMAKILKSLVAKAGVTASRCVISLPNSAVFTSVISLPKMNPKELASAVEFEAKKYVPLPIAETNLGWSVIADKNGNAEETKVLLTAVPKIITENYMRVFALAGLKPETGEIEALALIRSLIGGVPINCVIIDIGARATGINIIENGFLRLSRNLNVGGDTITERISETLKISRFRAEQFKRDFGVSRSTLIPDTIKPVLNTIKNEVKQLLAIYQSQNMNVEKILLVGGGSNLPEIVHFFEDLNLKVELGNPLATVGHSKSLETILQRNALSLSIAIGLALRNS